MLVKAPLGADTVDLLGWSFAPWTEARIVDHVISRLDLHGVERGGWIVTPNTDVLRQIVRTPHTRELVSDATVTLADGMPLVWASRLMGTPLPERVTGASLLLTLCAAAARCGRSVYLLGGAAGVAERAAHRLADRYPGLVISGWSPPFGLQDTEKGMAEIRSRALASNADLVFCGFGFPKQERIIAALRRDRPDAWYVGCGAAITFAAGELRRAPAWMQRCGLEWLHRLLCEPRRLFRRYLVNDLPFALGLLAIAARSRDLTVSPREKATRPSSPVLDTTTSRGAELTDRRRGA